MSEPKSDWQKVICPKGARPGCPVTISVTKKINTRYLTLSMSAALAARVGAEKGGTGSLYLNPAGTQLRLTTEDGPDSRAFVKLGGSRVSLIYPHRPFSNVLLEDLRSSEVKHLVAKKGELIIELPARVKPKA